MPIVIAIGVFALVLSAIGCGYVLFAAIQRTRQRRRVRVLIGDGTGVAAFDAISPAAKSGHAGPQSTGIRFFGRSLPIEAIRSRLLSASVAMPPERFLTAALALGLTCFFVAFGLSRNPGVSVLIMAVSTGLPFLYLRRRRRLRDDALTAQLPDALDMIVRALRVGQSVDNALKEVSESCPPPLRNEIRTIYEEIRLGIPFTAALRNFEARFARLADVKLMTSAFVLQRETGGNLTRLLANLSDLIRERDTLKRQVRAMTAEGRSSALILGVLPLGVGLFFWFVRPAYITVLFHHPSGRKMVLIAVLLEAAGFLVMRAMTRITP
jgi:tight adherence protein B